MFDVRDYIKKLLLLVPAGCVVLAAGITISGYEVQQVKVKEKSIPQFQLVKEETESKTSPFPVYLFRSVHLSVNVHPAFLILQPDSNLTILL